MARAKADAITSHDAGLQPEGRSNEIDVHVGRRLRLRRTLLGMSQSALGEALDLTFQQIQKYERGANRIGASRLYAMAQVLGVPVSYFFEGMEENRASSTGQPRVTAMPRDPATKRETLELVRAYYKIDDPALRLSLINTIKAIAAEEDAAADGE